MNWRKFWRVLTLTGIVYGFAGWIYIVINDEVHPYTLRLQLTHLAPWPHEDSFGETCFVISLICFFAYNMLREPRRRDD